MNNPFILLWTVLPASVFGLFLVVSRFKHREPCNTLKSFWEAVIFIFLFLLGAFEVFYGAFAGRVGVIREARFLREDLQPLNFTDAQMRVLDLHFDKLTMQWGVVTYFGIATIIVGIALLVLERKRISKVK